MYVRSGGWNAGESVAEPNVRDHLRAITSLHANSLRPDPLQQPGFASGRISSLTKLLRAFSLADGPVLHKNPLPASVVTATRELADTSALLESDLFASSAPSDRARHVSNLIECAFVMMLRPGEYTGSPHPLALGLLTLSSLSFLDADGAVLFADGRATSLLPAGDLAATLAKHAHQVCVTHIDQKNGQKGEWQAYTANDCYGDPKGIQICAVRAAARLTQALVSDGATPTTPLSRAPGSPRTSHITSDEVTTTLRSVTSLLGEEKLGILALHVSAHSLRTGGAYAYHLCGMHDLALRTLGRWRSDAILHYLKARSTKTGACASLLRSDALKCRQLLPFTRSKKRARTQKD